MKNMPAENQAVQSTAPPLTFRHVRSSLSYEDIRAVRGELTEFFQSGGIGREHAGNMLFAVTEILSNLVRHPPKKASYVEIKVGVLDAQINIEVLDDSTPFLDFREKCKGAMSGLRAAESGAENGYGLGCILTLFRNPVYSGGGEGQESLNSFRIAHEVTAENPLKRPSGKKTEKKIFLIDDDPVSLHIHQHILMKKYDVIVFERAMDALAAFHHQKPDLIISDIVMDCMDGIALRRALDKADGGNTTPFIFLSGHSDNEHNPYISQLGVDDFLCKPVSSERLHTVVGRLLHRSQQIRASVQGQFHHDITELLKPLLPEKSMGWNFITKSVVAEAGGGDFVLHQEDGKCLTSVLVDVMGHGRQAKFFSYVYAGYLRSMFRMHADSLDPARFLKSLSQSIDGDPLLESMIMTCQCFQLFPDGAIKIASAGHPCPIIRRRDGAKLMDVMGPLPGLIGDNAYGMKSAHLERGDKIVFMTDGFLDVFDRRGHAAEELLKLVENTPPSSAQEFSERLWKEFQIREKEYTLNKDDATMIIAEYGG